ncbi:hypothetical protein REPUB_Repub04eG0145700 [Reevesia pubescens]
MGRIRTKIVKKSSRQVIERYYSRMTFDFHTNKKIIEEVAIIPSKRLCNKITEFLTHLMKRIQKEAHTNGFRYSTSRPDERVDVMFRNIKHAFFQPAEPKMIIVVHFYLHNHIMVGNKKTKDVQFYIEVMDIVQTLGGGKRFAYDPDEIEEKQRERDRKNKINMDFQNFVNRVNDLSGQPQFKALDLEFDQHMRELGFYEVSHKAFAFIMPTSNCLVELIETPFVVITLSEIEIVNLERVGLGQKNFDMTIIEFELAAYTENYY